MSELPPRRSSRRVDPKLKRGPNPLLEKLRKVREGTLTHLEVLEDQQPADVFEELDDQAYLLRRQREVHFIEDDDGSGYVDHGQAPEVYSDEEVLEKKKSNKPVAPLEKRPTQLHSFFAGTQKLSLKREKPVATTELDIDSMLSHFDNRLAVLKDNTPQRKKFHPDTPRPPPRKVVTPVTKLSHLSLEDIPVEDNFKVPKLEPELLPAGDTLDSVEVMDDMGYEPEPAPPITPIKRVTFSEPTLPETSETSTWKTLQANLVHHAVTDDSETNALSIPTADEGGLYFYWFDAFAQEMQGQVYLLGKTYDSEQRKFVNACVVVQSIQRNIYLLPEPPIDSDADDEVKMARIQEVIEEIHPRWEQFYFDKEYNVGLVTRKFAFDSPTNMPAESEYIKITYPLLGKTCPFATNLKGTHFRHVFGANTSAMELFLIKRKIMGPGWLKIDQASLTTDPLSHCKVEYVTPEAKCVRPVKDHELEALNLTTPPFTVMSLAIKTVLNPKTLCNEIVSVNCCIFPNVNIDGDLPMESRPVHQVGAICQLPNTYIPPELKMDAKDQGFDLEIVTSEKALLNYLVSRIIFYDPDIFTGHHFLGFSLDVLLTRMNALNISTWSRLGRLRRVKIPKSCLGSGTLASSQQRNLINGRLICDTYLGAKDTVKSKNYTLGTLAKDLLDIQREDIPFDTITTYFADPKSIQHLVQHGFFDAYLVAAIMFKLQLLPLSKQLTALAGSLWNQTMTGARNKRNEFLLLHEFHNLKYICPDRASFSEDTEPGELGDELEPTTTSSRRKAAYSGGLVLEPKRGLYDSLVLLLDFNSLYPSIIQEFNICFTTVQRELDQTELPEVPDPSVPVGLLPKLLKNLIDRRAQVKSLLKDKNISPAKASQLDIRQKALKLTANSMYGCLGYPVSRFYAKPLAMLITAKGRETLQATVDLAKNEGLEIVYGDTDSIMINTHTQDIQQAKAIAYSFKKKVNQCYGQLEIDIDGIFKRLLLLQKKKYAALIINENLTTKLEAKGLDLVRREFCGLSQTMSKVVLDFILSGEDKESVVGSIHSYLTEMGQQIRSGAIPLDQFVIYKGLSKSVDKYADAGSQPQVQVALRLQKATGTTLGKGTTVDYIICQSRDDEAGSQSYAMRAFSLDEITKGNQECEQQGLANRFLVDYDWYFTRQLLPPIGRLCDVIEGTSLSRLAECLGLDPTKFGTNQSQPQSTNTSTLDSLVSNPERFESIPPWSFPCWKCQSPFTVEKLVVVNEGIPQFYRKCQQCGEPQSDYYFENQLILRIRRHIHQFNSRELVCSDPLCDGKKIGVALMRHPTAGLGRSCSRPSCDGSLQLKTPPHQLYTQLAYLTHLCDGKVITQTLNRENIPYSTVQSFLSPSDSLHIKLSTILDSYLALSGYRYVNLGCLFK